MTAVVTTTARALWKKLVSDAGLELRHKKGDPGRDADLEVAVLAQLRASRVGVPGYIEPNNVDALLAQDEALPVPRITTEVLLVAVLKSQRDFAAMMTDILDTLVMADARIPEHGLSVQFKVSTSDTPILQTLEEFRRTVQKIKEVLATRFAPPTSKQMWDLYHAFEKLVPEQPRLRRSSQNTSPTSEFPPPPNIVPTGNADADVILLQVSQLAVALRDWCLGYGTTRAQVMSEVRRLHLGDNIAIDRASVGHDLWDVTIAEQAETAAKMVADGVLAPAQLTSTIEPILASMDTEQTWVSRTYTELLDILDLPAWRKRHELYSVWVGCILLRTVAANSHELRFHPVGGVLSFAFGGSRLATYVRGADQYDVWAELRSPGSRQLSWPVGVNYLGR